MRKFHGPFAWKGEELWQKNTSLHHLSREENQALRAALADTKSNAIPLTAIEKHHFASPVIDSVLVSACHELEDGCGVFRMRGLDLKGLCQADIERIFWGIARHIGTPVSQSAAGERMYRVEDQGYKSGNAKARGPNTRRALSFHTDRCDVIGFCCVRQAEEGGESLLASAATIHNEILQNRPNLLKMLYQPFYWQRHNVDTGNAKPWCQLPIFAPCKGRFMANIMRVLIDRGHQLNGVAPLTDLQKQALDYFEQTARRPEIHCLFRQEPGDLLFVNNLLICHSRHEFKDAMPPLAKRLLLRLWLATPVSRELDPVYAALYGSYLGGTIRGGMKRKMI